MTLADKLAAGLDATALAATPWMPVPLHRVHNKRFGPVEFNPTPYGNARFSPPRVPDGSGGERIVPTIYAGTTVEVALMQTALHDASIPSNGYILREQDIVDLRATGVQVSLPLHLVDFRVVPLGRLGLTRPEVVDSDKTHYPNTRALAAWTYQTRPDAQGIVWVSRQDDRGEALVLFEDRIPAGTLTAMNSDQLLTSGAIYASLLDLLGLLGASLQAD